MRTAIAFLLSILVCGADIATGLVCDLDFQTDWTSSLQINDASGHGNHAQIPRHTPYVVGSYAPVRGNGGPFAFGMMQTNFGGPEYRAIVTAAGQDYDAHFPGYVLMSYAAITNLNGLRLSTNLTAAMWIKLSQNGVDNPSMTILSAGWTSHSNSWSLTSSYNESSGQLSLTRYTNVQANPQHLVTVFPALATNIWWHLVVTMDGSNNVTKAYTNGVLAASGVMGADYYTVSTNGGQAYIGLLCNSHGDSWEVDPENGDVSPNNGWAGEGTTLSSLKLFNRTLTAGDVLELYQATNSLRRAYVGVGRGGKVVAP